MDEYIEREAAIKAACGAVWFGGGGPSVTAAINQIPAADVAPVRHGRWLKNTRFKQNPWKCSECGFDPKFRFNFCPNCGVKMD